jgi:hypothetical protein
MPESLKDCFPLRCIDFLHAVTNGGEFLLVAHRMTLLSRKSAFLQGYRSPSRVNRIVHATLFDRLSDTCVSLSAGSGAGSQGSEDETID